MCSFGLCIKSLNAIVDFGVNCQNLKGSFKLDSETLTPQPSHISWLGADVTACLMSSLAELGAGAAKRTSALLQGQLVEFSKRFRAYSRRASLLIYLKLTLNRS